MIFDYRFNRFKFQKRGGSIGCIASFRRNADSGARYAIGSDDMTCALIDSKISTSFDDQDFSKNEEEYMLADDLSSPYVVETINECILEDHVDYIRALHGINRTATCCLQVGMVALCVTRISFIALNMAYV